MIEYMTKKREALITSKNPRLTNLIDLYFNPLIGGYADPYTILVDLLEEFGQIYLLPAIRELIPRTLPAVVDFGAGSGWLGRALAEDEQAVFVDRRVLVLEELRKTAILLDLEDVSQQTAERLKNLTEDTDLSIACEVLHCINEEAQLQLLRSINSKVLLVVEQLPEGRHGVLAELQISLASSQPLLSRDELFNELADTGWTIVAAQSVYHYIILKCMRD